MATAVMTSIKSLEDMVRAMCLNTIISKIGHTNGISALLQEKLAVGIISSKSSCRLLSLFACDGPGTTLQMI